MQKQQYTSTNTPNYRSYRYTHAKGRVDHNAISERLVRSFVIRLMFSDDAPLSLALIAFATS